MRQLQRPQGSRPRRHKGQRRYHLCRAVVCVEGSAAGTETRENRLVGTNEPGRFASSAANAEN